MKLDAKELDNYPDVLNKEQFRIVCHISKRTALYLLESGLVKAQNTGKKTHSWLIRKEDILAFAEERERNPVKFVPPDNWYVYGEPEPNFQAIRFLPMDDNCKELTESYYEKLLADELDLITVADVIRITGYKKNTITRWVRDGKVHVHYARANRSLFPKPFLLDFLCSEVYNNILRKSVTHICAIWEIHDSLTKPHAEGKEK